MQPAWYRQINHVVRGVYRDFGRIELHMLRQEVLHALLWVGNVLQSPVGRAVPIDGQIILRVPERTEVPICTRRRVG